MKILSIPSLIVFIGAFLSAIGAIWASARQANYQQALQEKSDTIAEKSDALARKSDELAKKSDELAKKSEEIARLNREMLQQVTGGDAFCVISPAPAGTNQQATYLEIHALGDYNVYDVTVTISDLERTKPIVRQTPINIQQLLAAREVLNLGTVLYTLKQLPNGTLFSTNPRFIKLLNLPESGRLDLVIEFTARNGVFIEFLIMRRVNNHWTAAIQVSKDEKILHENIPDDFPREANGTINWSEIGIRWLEKK
jgi:hypothetical protein